ADPHASMITRDTARLANQRSNWLRVRRAVSMTFHLSSATAIWNTLLAKSTATVVAFMIGRLLLMTDPHPHEYRYRPLGDDKTGVSIPSLNRTAESCAFIVRLA